MKGAKKKLTALILTVLTAGILAGCGSADKVGVVDTQRVQKEAPLAKQYVEKHEQKVQEINKKLAEEKLSMSDEDFQKEQQKQKQELDI